MCFRKPDFWVARRPAYGTSGNFKRNLHLERCSGFFVPPDYIKRPILGVYKSRHEAELHPHRADAPTAWVVVKRLCDPGWDYLPRIVRCVLGEISLDDDDEEYVEAVFLTELAAQLYVGEWDAAYDWKRLRL